MAVTDDYIADMRERVRTAQNRTDGELRDLVEAARVELILAGILSTKANDEADPLVKATITTYIKAEYGIDVPDAEKYRESFDIRLKKMATSNTYIIAVPIVISPTITAIEGKTIYYCAARDDILSLPTTARAGDIAIVTADGSVWTKGDTDELGEMIV